MQPNRLLFFWTVMVSALLLAYAQTPKEILTELYSTSAGGRLWLEIYGNTTVCDWQGIHCNGNGNVVRLQPSFALQAGRLTESLGQLITLEEIDFQDLLMTGSIPASIGQLVNLRRLNLLNNVFESTIPASIGQLTNLEDLFLEVNRISGTIPGSIANLTKLENIRLFNNKLSGTIPSFLFNLPELQTLFLHYNDLDGAIPQSISQARSLREFIFRNNSLDTFEQGISPPASLESCDLSSNELICPIPSWAASRCQATCYSSNIAVNNIASILLTLGATIGASVFLFH